MDAPCFFGAAKDFGHLKWEKRTGFVKKKFYWKKTVTEVNFACYFLSQILAPIAPQIKKNCGSDSEKKVNQTDSHYSVWERILRDTFFFYKVL